MELEKPTKIEKKEKYILVDYDSKHFPHFGESEVLIEYDLLTYADGETYKDITGVFVSEHTEKHAIDYCKESAKIIFNGY